MAQLHGICADAFQSIASDLSDQLDCGDEVGASICIIKDGETLVDLWGGHADADRTTPWSAETITNVWSITKTMSALCALILIDRGELDPYQRVAHYWPEFAANGKEAVEVRHVLSHTSGVSAWEQPISLDEVYDTEAAADRLATQAPWWEPGSASGYHLMCQGHLIGEIVRRISGQTLGEFFATHVARPLNADFHIGLDPAEYHRIAPVIPPTSYGLDLSQQAPDSVAIKSFTGPFIHPKATLTDEWRRAELGGINGHGNARSVARSQAAVSHGGEFDDVRLLSPSTIDLIFDKQSDGTDLVLLMPLRFGMGYALPQTSSIPVVPDGRRCFWGGYGGSMVINDLDNQLTFAYVMNNMAGDVIGSPRANTYISSLYAALG